MELAPGGAKAWLPRWWREAHGPLEAHGYPAAGAFKPGITPPQPTVPEAPLNPPLERSPAGLAHA